MAVNQSHKTGALPMETEVQLQAKTFITPTRPRLTSERRELTAYEISSIKLDREMGWLPPAPPVCETIDVADFIDSPEQIELADGSFKVRARLFCVTRAADRRSWYEIRVGGRHRFAYASVKAAARAFNKLSAQSLQPTGWISSNGGARAETPQIPQPTTLLTALPRMLGWNLSASY
jgi:hypothetical protein